MDLKLDKSVATGEFRVALPKADPNKFSDFVLLDDKLKLEKEFGDGFAR